MDVHVEEEEMTGVRALRRALKEGHKLVLRAKEDGLLFLGLVYFEGASEEARGKEKQVK